MSCITVYNKLQELAEFQSEGWADGAVITLGRDEMTTFPLPDIASLSSHHLSIRKLAGDFYIRDEQSSNGTTADGVPMTYALRMHANVEYKAGPLTICLENAPATTPNPEENADSVFPEPYRFACIPVEEAPVAEPVAEYYAEPAPAEVYAEPAVEQVAAPEPEEDFFDLEAMAARKQAQQAEPVYTPEAAYEPEPVYTPEPEAVYAPEPAPQQYEAVAEAPQEMATAPSFTPVPKKRIINQQGVVRPFLPIAGIPKTGIPQDFALEISTLDGRPCITEGESLQLLVRSSEKCKVILICQEQDGTKTMLYPNKYQTSMDIPANTWVAIPEEGSMEYELSIEGAGCIDTIQAIARKSTTSSIKRTHAPKKGDKKSLLDKEAKPKKPQAQWAYAHIDLQVVGEGDDAGDDE